MSLIQQYQIELSKTKKELQERQIDIRTYLTKIAETSNPFNYEDVENVKIDEIKVFCRSLETAINEAVKLNKKIKAIEKEIG